MRTAGLLLSCATLLCSKSVSLGALGVVVSEDFESYADTAEMSAVWQGADGRLDTELDYDLDGTPDEFNKTAYHPGGSVNILSLDTPLFAKPGEWIRLSVDIFDDDTSLDPAMQLNAWNKRMSLGFRANTPSNLLELGIWNSLREGRFAHRAILFDSLNGTPNPNWAAWDLGTETILIGDPPQPVESPINNFVGASWHRLSVTIKPESLLYEFDMFRDGSIDKTNEYFDIRPTAEGFGQLRFGGPSGVTSAGGGVHFDNILLEVIAPEPSSLGLLALGGVALLPRSN